MILFLLSSFISSIKIYKHIKQPFLFENSKNDSVYQRNIFCPTFSSSQKPITTSCLTKYMPYINESYEPAYVVDSSKSTLTIEIQYCNFSHYKLTALPIYSLIHITGSNSVNLNAEQCNFQQNKFPHSAGIFYLSSGDHIISIVNTNFLQNEGSKATILSNSCSLLTMSNCYIAHNKCDYYQGQIYLKANSNNKNNPLANDPKKSINSLQISFSRVTFLLNECMTTNSILLEGYKSISFDRCSFSCGGTPKHFIELKGHDIISSFTECCFYGYFKFYAYDYYHIYFTYTFGNKANFYGINSFGGEKMNSINYSPPDEGNSIFKINECVHVDPTATPTPTISKVPLTLTPTQSKIPSASLSSTETQFLSETSSQAPSFISYTDEYLPSFTESLSQSTSDSDNDNGNESSKNNFQKTMFIILLSFIVVALIVGIVVGWFLSKSCHRKDNVSLKLNTSDTFHSTLLSD